MTAEPRYRADHVGSLLRPGALLKARRERAEGLIGEEALRALEDQAIGDAVRLQELVGLRAITDGEIRRDYWNFDFLCGFDNVSLAYADDGRRPFLDVRGPLARSRPILVEQFAYLKSLTSAEPKLAIPSPDYLHGRGVSTRSVYQDEDAFFADIACAYREEIADLYAAGCRYLQLDTPNFAFLCDPEHRETVSADPDALVRRLAGLISETLRDRPSDLTVVLHTCRGNFQSMSFAEGGYEPVADVLFNEVDVDGYFLEYDNERSGDFTPLRWLPDHKFVVLGLVSSKTGELEARDVLKRRVAEAADIVPIERLALSPQCGFASVADGGNLLTPEEQTGKLRLVVEVAKEIWPDDIG